MKITFKTLILMIGILGLLNCSGSDDDNTPTNQGAGPSFVTLKIDGAEVFNRSSNAANPSSEMVSAILTTQSFTMNGVSIPENSLMIFSKDTQFQTTGLGKSVSVIARNITGTGSFPFAIDGSSFFYSNTSVPTDAFIAQIMEPYETTATVNIIQIGNMNPEMTGRYVSGNITGTALAGPVSDPDDEVAIVLDFNGGVQ